MSAGQLFSLSVAFRSFGETSYSGTFHHPVPRRLLGRSRVQREGKLCHLLHVTGDQTYNATLVCDPHCDPVPRDVHCPDGYAPRFDSLARFLRPRILVLNFIRGML